jgi:hypothetical protein
LPRNRHGNRSNGELQEKLVHQNSTCMIPKVRLDARLWQINGG